LKSSGGFTTLMLVSLFSTSMSTTIRLPGEQSPHPSPFITIKAYSNHTSCLACEHTVHSNLMAMDDLTDSTTIHRFSSSMLQTMSSISALLPPSWRNWPSCTSLLQLHNSPIAMVPPDYNTCSLGSSETYLDGITTDWAIAVTSSSP